MLCEDEHKNHKIIIYRDIFHGLNEIKENINKFKEEINKFKENVNNIINILNITMDNIDIYYKKNYDIMKNFEIRHKNYQILKNLNEIKNNFIINDIKEIINDYDFNNKFKNIYKLYNKIIDKSDTNEYT